MDFPTRIVQFNPYPGAISRNVVRMREEIRKARDDKVALLIFPEMAITGYCIGDLHKRMSFLAEARAALEELGRASKEVVVVTGFLDYDSSKQMRDGCSARYNAYAVLGEGKVLGTGKKSLLIDDGVLDDSRHYLAGDPEEIRPVQVTLNGRRRSLGIMICQDIWDVGEDIQPAKILAAQGAELLITINCSPYYVGRLRERHAVAARKATETGLPLIYCNTAGVQDNGKNIIIFDGGSFLVDAKGKVRAQLPQFADGAWSSTTVEETAEDIVELFEALVFALKDFFTKTGVFTGAVLGLSGGVDSAVDAALLGAALGPERVLCVNMPSRFNSDVTKRIAERIARELDMEFIVHPIEDVLVQKCKDFTAHAGHEARGLVLENMQARERGNILMQYAQQRRAMVVGNGNKTEFQRGYATLYGDILGALMPLGDVSKRDVYRLAHHINERGDKKVLPTELFAIPPSAELSDEQSVDAGRGDPFDYGIESPLGSAIVEDLQTPRELREAFLQRKLLPPSWPADLYERLDDKTFLRMATESFQAIFRSSFKRVQAPPIIRVSRRAFGFDYRETLFNGWEG